MEKVCDDLLQKWKIDEVEDQTAVKIASFDNFTLKRFWLVGRLLTEKQYNKFHFKQTMKRVWKTREEVIISEWEGSDRFLFAFRSDSGRKLVLRGSPWSFDNALLLLAISDGKTNPVSIPLETQNFWIRVRGLPPCLLSRAMGKFFGSTLGTFVDIDATKGGDCTGSYLNIRVGLDISKPLRRWVKIEVGDDEESKLGLEYENLPFFCLFCGRLAHVSSGCPLAKEGLITEPQYGRWKTLAKNVFCIDPCGQLTGVSFGLTKKKTPWQMKAPEMSITGQVRSRDDLARVEVCSEMDMEVDQPRDDCPLLTKRRRVILGGEGSTPGMHISSELILLPKPIPLPTPSENIQCVLPGTHDPWPSINLSGEVRACQKPGGMGVSMGCPVLNPKHPGTGGTFDCLAGSILNFENPLGHEQPSTNPSPTVGPPVKRTTKKISEARGSATTVAMNGVAKEKNSPLTDNASRSFPEASIVVEIKQIEDTSPKTSETISTSSSVSPSSTTPLEECFSVSPFSAPPIQNSSHNELGGRTLVISSPMGARPINLIEGITTEVCTGIIISPMAVNTSSGSSPGRTPKRLSVMGPVLTHHEP